VRLFIRVKQIDNLNHNKDDIKKDISSFSPETNKTIETT